MISPERIEAAARADWERAHGTLRSSFMWENIRPEIRADRMFRVQVILAAAFPELASDPPKAWVAPWEATDGMQAAYFADMGRTVFEDWAAMRDASLKEQAKA